MTDESPPEQQPTPKAGEDRTEPWGAWLGCGGLLALCLLCGGCPWWSDTTYSEGERVGVIVKFSHKGVIWKSWEGEMHLGGARAGGDGAVPNLWHFSLRRGEEGSLVQKVTAAQD